MGEKEKFIPGMESESQFKAAVKILHEWIKDGIVEAEVDADGDIEFILPREMDSLLEINLPSGLKQENLVRIIRTEVPYLIQARFSDDPEKYLKRSLPDQLINNRQKIEKVQKRLSYASEMLIDENFKKKYLLRKVTNGYVFRNLRWITGAYHYKSESIDIDYISIKLMFIKPNSQKAAMVINPQERTMEIKREDDVEVHLELHRDDLEKFIKELKKILDEIKNVGSKGRRR